MAEHVFVKIFLQDFFIHSCPIFDELSFIVFTKYNDCLLVCWFWSKIMLFSNHLWNSTTEMILQWVYIKQRETERESTYLHTSYSKKTAQCAMEPNKVFQIEFESYLLWQHLTGWSLFESCFCFPFYQIYWVGVLNSILTADISAMCSNLANVFFSNIE